MTNSEADSHQESLKELIEEISAVELEFYPGGVLGMDFISLDGKDVKKVREIQEKYGAEGMNALNASVGPIIEGNTQEKIDSLNKKFQKAQEFVTGGPYDPSESEYQRLAREGLGGMLVTTEDYNSYEMPLAAYGRYLHAYRRGDAVEVYLAAKPIEVTGVLGNKGTFPPKDAKKITFKKPAVNARTGIV